MSANTEKCADKEKTVCEYNEFRRLKYFHGMLLDDKDFQAEQQYHAGKRRFLNRMLHGSGVVCGLELKSEIGKRWIQVTPGLALDCSGNEIWVPNDFKIDLASLLPPKNKPEGEPKCKPTDEKDELKTYYIGIRYEEKPTNPVSVYLPSGSCEEKTCENSRWKEGYCVEIVECCYPEEDPGLLDALCKCEDASYDGDFVDLCKRCGKDPRTKDEQKKGFAAQLDPNANEKYCKCMRLEEFCEQSVPCGECCSCDKPCHVILGQIKVDDNCLVQQLCINECRRYVLTGRLIQHLILRLLKGAESSFQLSVGGAEFQLLSAVDLAYNPIKAICDIFTKFGVNEDKPEIKDCKGKPGNQVTVFALQNQLSKMQKRQDELESRIPKPDVYELRDHFNALQREHKNLQSELAKLKAEYQKQPKK